MLLGFVQVLFACDKIISPGADIATEIDNLAPNSILCLNKGTYYPSATIRLKTGQELSGLAADHEIITQREVLIKSDFNRIIVAGNNNLIRHVALSNDNSPILPVYGILNFNNSNVTIWSVRIDQTLIGIGASGADDIEILHTFIYDVGYPFNGIAEPSIWISNSQNITIWYGVSEGRNDGPGGDGEVASYNSNNVSITGRWSSNVGASSFYFVNCDNCSISNARSINSDEWGIDVVDDSDAFYAENNHIQNSNFGGAVFFETTLGSSDPDFVNTLTGNWKGNMFINNNTSGVANCQGINIRTNPSNAILINNTSTGAISCPW